MALTVIHPNGAPETLDEVEVSFLDRFDPLPPPAPELPESQPQEPGEAVVAGIGHAFLLDLEHPPLMLQGLFEASEMFDFHEVGAEPRHLIVDVMEVTPTRTTLHVKPDGALTYDAIAREVAGMVDSVGSRIFGGQLRPARLQWIVEPVGIPSTPIRVPNVSA